MVIIVLADVVVLSNEVFVYLCGNFISISIYVCMYVVSRVRTGAWTMATRSIAAALC